MDIEQEYELVDVEQLTEHPQNPRRGNVEAIDESIDKNGWYGVCTVQRSTGYILAGNHRYRAAVKRGAKQVPVVWRDCDDQTAMRIMLADNRTADLGVYDEELLTELLNGLESLEGTGWGQVLDQAAQTAEKAEEGLLEPSEDVYSPAYGLMIVCDGEEDQREKYERLEAQYPDWQLRVVAV